MKLLRNIVILALLSLFFAGCAAKSVGNDFGGWFDSLKERQDYDSYDTASSLNTKTTKDLSSHAEPTIMLPKYTGPTRTNDLAVVIGIETYRNIPQSDFSSRDALYVKAYLKGLGYEDRNIIYLTNERAALTDIKKAVEGWLKNNVKSNSTVILYYSGHGSPEPDTGNAYILPYDGDPNYLSTTAYSLKNLYSNLSNLKAKEVIVMLDSCFSGSGGRSVIAKGARSLVRKDKSPMPLSENIIILSATQDSQISTSAPDKQHGLFTYYLLKSIENGNKDIVDIYNYLKPNVENEARRLNVEQSPNISADVTKIVGKYRLW